jgi:hypothetical protein
MPWWRPAFPDSFREEREVESNHPKEPLCDLTLFQELSSPIMNCPITRAHRTISTYVDHILPAVIDDTFAAEGT